MDRTNYQLRCDQSN